MKHRNGEHPYGDLGQMLFAIVFLIIWIGDSFFFKIFISLRSYIPLFIRIIVLVISITLALILETSGHVVVNEKKRPVVVISSGIFKYIRHPLYLSSLLLYFGLAASTLSIIAFVFFIIVFIFYNYIAAYEEKVMEQKFGNEYKNYKMKTGKWLPKIG